jgi:hypothetical protein
MPTNRWTPLVVREIQWSDRELREIRYEARRKLRITDCAACILQHAGAPPIFQLLAGGFDGVLYYGDRPAGDCYGLRRGMHGGGRCGAGVDGFLYIFLLCSCTREERLEMGIR